MEWLDYADCAGDDPLKWDLDHVEADDVQAYARSVCGDCPVRRECAAHAIDDRPQLGRIATEVVAGSNVSNGVPVRVEMDRVGDSRQEGVIRGGVALVGEYEPLLYEVAGRDWHGLPECRGTCGRPVYWWPERPEFPPEGSVCTYGKSGFCKGCHDNAPSSPRAAARARRLEAADLRSRGWSAVRAAERIGVSTRTVERYWSQVDG